MSITRKHPSLENNRDGQQWAIEFYQTYTLDKIEDMEDWEYIDALEEWFAGAIQAGNCAC